MKVKKEKSEIPINPIKEEVIALGDKFENAEPTIQVIVNENGKIESPKWIAEIETLCNEQGILPEDMVREWKEMKKKEKLYHKNKENAGNFAEFKAGKSVLELAEEKNTTTGLSKWQLELRKKKLGI
jgi:hypothetical protein